MNKKKKLLFSQWLSGGGSAPFVPSAEYQAVLDYATTQAILDPPNAALWALPDTTERIAIDTAIREDVISGAYARYDALWHPATSGGRNFAKINYKNPGTFNLVEMGATPPVFTPRYGFSSGGVGYLDTGFKLQTNGVNYTTNDCHFCIGISSQTLVPVLNSNYVDFGVSGAGLVGGVRYSAGQAGGQTALQLNSSNTKAKTYNGIDFGYAIAERRSSGSVINRNRSYVVDTVSETFTTPNNGNVYMCCMNVNGTPSFHSPRHVSHLSLGGGLTDAISFSMSDGWKKATDIIQGVGAVTENATYSVYESPYEVIATRDNYQFATDGYNIRFSSDYGATWTVRPWGEMLYNSTQFDYRYAVTGAHIFSTGTLLFSVSNKLYRSTDGLATAPVEIGAKNADGSPYVFHTPVDPIRPGVHFGQWDVEPEPSTLTNGDEILVIGVYTNLNMGAAPISIWYSRDDGATVKLAFQFGQNTEHRDDGTEDGGTTGTLLGDAGQTNLCRHMHCLVRRPGTLDWYFATGDRTVVPEIGWYKLTYDENADTWGGLTILHKPVTANEWKSSAIRFSGTDLYFITDGGATLGVYRGPIASIGTLGAFTRILATTVLCYGNRINLATGFMITVQANNNIKVSTGFGAANVDHTVLGASATGSGPSTMLAPSNVDSRGYYKVNVGGMAWGRPLKTVFIKEN